MKEEYKKIIEAAQVGGQILKKYFGQNLAIEQKTIPADIRTKADTESEKAILNILKKEFPDYNILSEESEEIKNNSEYTLIIDPLDGSNNFILGMPYFSVIIALQKNKETIFGVIYDPILDRTYYAIKDHGAFLNNQKIKVNGEENLKRVSLGIAWSYVFDKELNSDYTKKLINSDLKRISLNWSIGLDLCSLASGKIEAFVNNGCDPHDYVAGKLIVQEAGGVIVDFSGHLETDATSDEFIVSNNKIIADKILKLIKN